ncbi:hypothetical protein PMIN01_09713 [Paraphaeosphaeria minitans]|uniref:Uncharacterized protein n=1 Tax=Paraphaeosphaeria minitans TaxID=565426 RepID=A0A9P6KMR9_9PLEO|nr:hypothetical protein PMIN01_09713 [Paraphaeosphaeria minitans]
MQPHLPRASHPHRTVRPRPEVCAAHITSRYSQQFCKSAPREFLSLAEMGAESFNGRKRGPDDDVLLVASGDGDGVRCAVVAVSLEGLPTYSKRGEKQLGDCERRIAPGSLDEASKFSSHVRKIAGRMELSTVDANQDIRRFLDCISLCMIKKKAARENSAGSCSEHLKVYAEAQCATMTLVILPETCTPDKALFGWLDQPKDRLEVDLLAQERQRHFTPSIPPETKPIANSVSTGALYIALLYLALLYLAICSRFPRAHRSQAPHMSRAVLKNIDSQATRTTAQELLLSQYFLTNR